MTAPRFDYGLDGLAISDQREVYGMVTAPKNSRTYWVVVRLKGGEEAGRYVWKVAGDSPAKIEKHLRDKYPKADIRVVREAYAGERFLP